MTTRSKKKSSGKSNSPALLFFDSTDRSADLYYFGRFQAPDPFIAYRSRKGKKVAVLSALEYSRGLKEGEFDRILALEDLRTAAGKRLAVNAGYPEVIAEIAHQEEIAVFTVPQSFPLGLANRLEKLGVALEVADGDLFPERLKKSKKEREALREGCAASSAGLARAADVLRESEIRGKKIWWRGEVLTSEILRFEVDLACLKLGARADNTIVAGGDQACDPHCRGTGPLRPNELIIIDVFPRVETTGYHGDLTRTFLKGNPSDAQVKLVETVRKAQTKALEAIRTGVTGDKVHQTVAKYFEKKGYQTLKENGEYRGFFHSTGHGLGLEIHEGPRLGPGAGKLETDMVVTVEPGLYYPGLGGVRIEDVVRVTPKGAELLSDCSYHWVL